MNNKLTIQKTPNDLGSLAEEKVLWFTPQAKSLGIELVSDIDTSISKVMYDPKYMSHVLNNLMSNSLKYTPSGGMITVSVKQEGTDVRVSVFDNGKGIPTEKQKQLFQKFTNINAANDKTVSTGLGLFVVKGIVEAHGGKITIETQQNRGYKVSFTIPMTTMPASLVGAPTATVDAPLAPITPPIAG
jgi:two-component system sensor histidine kinase VicK